MGHEPGLRWLVALETINDHTLSDFRTQQLERLQGILTPGLARGNLVDFPTLLQDGTKMEAQAGRQSFHRRPPLTGHLAERRRCVEELDGRAAESEAGVRLSQSEAAAARAAPEKLQWVEAALAELERHEAAAPAKRWGRSATKLKRA